ncbi:membrane protein [Pectobacterium phage vB_PcaM_CBB]|uniref:Putative membrane protein n=1 Tax=Pectobacterium phage vB_PcaM_CBB TaxID=2772511 RepID=A0A1L2CUR3_9CAUD|nr:membrane protein [Pectobacterium phage vB_PcaM_CBB]AMM43739.1 putative membrane protein [Pectobacterium phage vB_PcaM_CBB]
MATAMLCIQILSIFWFLAGLANNGYMGIRMQRRIKFLLRTTDKDSSSMIIRIIERYNNGEFTVQKSKYNDNLLFTKVIGEGALSYDTQRMYVQVDEPLDKCFGWVSDEPIHVVHYKQNFKDLCNGRGAISFEAWSMLMELRSKLNEDSEKPVRHGFFKRKHKNEEVHLS